MFGIIWARRNFSYSSHLAEQGHMTHKSLFALSLRQFPWEAFSDTKSSSKGQGERRHTAIKHRNPSYGEIVSACLDIRYIDFHSFLPGVITILATLPQFKRCSLIEPWFNYLEIFKNFSRSWQPSDLPRTWLGRSWSHGHRQKRPKPRNHKQRYLFPFHSQGGVKTLRRVLVSFW